MWILALSVAICLWGVIKPTCGRSIVGRPKYQFETHVGFQSPIETFGKSVFVNHDSTQDKYFIAVHDRLKFFDVQYFRFHRYFDDDRSPTLRQRFWWQWTSEGIVNCPSVLFVRSKVLGFDAKSKPLTDDPCGSTTKIAKDYPDRSLEISLNNKTNHVVEMGSNGIEHNPSPFAVNQSFRAGFSSIGSYRRGIGLFFYNLESPDSSVKRTYSYKDQEHIWQVCSTKKATEVAVRFAGGCYCLLFGCLLLYGASGRKLRRVSGSTLVGFGLAAFLFPPYYKGDCEDSQHPPLINPLHGNNVTQKLLTKLDYCNTLIASGRHHMANVLSTDKQIAVIGALAEGSSIRSIERITGVHRDTIMRLGVRVGKGCARLLDAKMRDLPCKHLQFDEIWGFIGKKERHCRPDDSLELGDVWTFCAIDPETKLVPSFKCGKRDLVTANAFVSDVASRIRNRVQISSDALRAYVDAIEMNFGADVDFAQIVKTYVTDDSHVPERRFSAPEIVITEKKTVSGFPDLRKASTSHIERLNGTTRLHMRRLTRLTYAFSKKLENFEAAIALHFAYYNFVKRHITLRATPAMAAGIERDFLTVGNLVEAA